MSKHRVNDNLINELFNVLPDVCATGTHRYWNQAESTGIVDAISPEQAASFRLAEQQGTLSVHLLQANSFDPRPTTIEKH